MHTKPAKEIEFGDRLDDEQVYFPFSGILPIEVREDRDGWLRIHDGHNEGWADKDDFILATDAPAATGSGIGPVRPQRRFRFRTPHFEFRTPNSRHNPES